MEEYLHYYSHTERFYDRPVNPIPSNGSSSSVPSGTMMSLPLIVTSCKVGNTRSKRKYEYVPNRQSSYAESCLLQLCRGHRWTDVVNRCRYYPEEACLVPLHRDDPTCYYSTNRVISPSIHGGDSDATPLFRETALGIVCASKYIGTEEGKQVILALLHENPNQIWASQCVAGQTPLREAILNGSCTAEIFQILVDAALTFRGGSLALHQKDENGLKPIDHLLISIQLGSSQDSLFMLRQFIRLKQSIKSLSLLDDQTSPLIRLLTMGKGLDLSASHNKSRKLSLEHRRQESNKDTSRLDRVLCATRILLDDDPNLLFTNSNVTKCTPLHVALRNYGKFTTLIQELLHRDRANKMVQTSNVYGDFPIHVACSVGVPFDVLGLVIEKTVNVATNSNAAKDICDVPNCKQHPLIWSCNKSGHRPVDLEWIFHIESGDNEYTARHFCTSDAGLVKQHCLKHDNFYRDLLKKSVNEIVRFHDSEKNSPGFKNDKNSRKEEAEKIFGYFLSHHATPSSTETKFETNPNAFGEVVDSPKLGTPYSASLPLPILELFLWLHPEEAMERDSSGLLPIHHALRYGLETFCLHNPSTALLSLTAVEDWKSFIFQLLDKTEEQSKVECGRGRLPLHYALDQSQANTSTGTSLSRTTSALDKAIRLSRHAIIKKLIDLYPGSVDEKDPVTGLYPFMMASSDTTMPLNTVFFILRRSPSRCLTLAINEKY
eukprot:CAMPEP_0116126598 /NCGR_PEP_ID=MMETSP0329-20121206/6413_1 /TAXON_ID=697910 /ORGANISM="Pseudo-nitzschia arenysensis, Strain B593" /LENGTH=716 /DNA_ID=CAMNT_0003620683 /DNA_START=176 /DNA_END=2327 /DNA_ORIENTATION=-